VLYIDKYIVKFGIKALTIHANDEEFVGVLFADVN
jgi:hypothetical protein